VRFGRFPRPESLVAILGRLLGRICVTALVVSGGVLTQISLEPFQACAAEPNYSARKWQRDEGLPHNSVTAVLQTHDGYIWIGTYGGLVRFDGIRFTVFDTDNTPSLKNDRITSLYEDAGDALWIGHETGDLTRLRNGVFEPVLVPGGWNGGKIMRIGADENGDIWLMNKEGLLARLRDGTRIEASPDASSAPGLASMARDRGGVLWLLRGGRLSFLEHGKLAGAQPRKLPGVSPITAFCLSHDGGVWLIAARQLRKWKDGDWVESLAVELDALDAATILVETPTGALALGTTDQGIYLLSPGTAARHLTRAGGLAQDWVTCFCIDREGDLWAGSGNGGLSELRQVNVQALAPPDRWHGMTVLSVCEGQDGSVWVGTEGAGVYQFQHDSWKQFGVEAGLANKFVWSVLEDTQARLWVGTWGGGLFVRRGERFETAPGLEGVLTPIPALLLGKNGVLWAGTGMGLLRYHEGQSRWFGHEQGLQVPDVRAVYEDAQGAVWFGMSGGGLGCLTNGAIKQYRKVDGLASDFVYCLQPDSSGALWIGTGGGGLDRLKAGKFAAIGVKEGLPGKIIAHVEEDADKNFWMSTEQGIIRVRESELNECADRRLGKVNCLIYGLGDGLETLDCSSGSQPSGCKTPDGRLWFATRKGLAVVDPSNLKTNSQRPPVFIEQMLLDGAPFGNLGTVQSVSVQRPLVRVPPGRHSIELEYTALCYTAPEKVGFRYRLEGLDSQWVDAKNQRALTYNYLPPGRYIFHVTACNNDGVWNEEGASLALDVPPFFWQTWWFDVLAYLVGGLAVGAVVWLEARRRHRRKLEILERQSALERERARIAKDIHDELGASLTHIALLSQSAHKDLSQPARTARHLDDIYGTSRELTRAMDEIVWAVNPKRDTLDSVASYLVKFAQEFLNPAGIRLRLDLPLHLPDWNLSAEVRHNLYLAFKEALNNVVRHAEASEVRISLQLLPSALTFMLRVEDNGKGFEESVSAPRDRDRLATGNGLDNLRRRTQQIGGSCTIESAPGQGTKVSLTVTLNPGKGA
jgi:ligand-binding sensor domain-containing protein/signal transduction histidine kinase